MTAPRLRRNRDFLLLQAAQLLSSGGSQISAIAYPLLVLALTGSAAKAGIVAFARAIPTALFALPSGLAADHWDRRRVMIAAHALRAVAIGTLAALVLLDEIVFAVIPAVAFVEGIGSSLTGAAQHGALRSVVQRSQLPTAIAVVTGREAAVGTVAPPLGGLLFGFSRAFPFLAHTASYVLSTLALLAIRTPFQEQREPDPAGLRERLAEGFRFLWGQPFLRTAAFLFGLANFIGPGVLLALLVIGRREGLSSGEVGLLVGAFGAAIVVGAFLSPFVRRALPARGVLLLELWTWTGCALFVAWPSVYVLAASILPTAVAIPSTDSVVHSLRLSLTPDRLIGRTSSVWQTIGLAIAPLGPLSAGFLLDHVSERATIGFFAAFGLVLAVWGTLSPSIRKVPTLDEVTEPPPASVP